MLTELTPEQESLIPVVRQEWLNKVMRLPKLDEAKAKAWVEWLYKFAGSKIVPKVVFLDSPMACQLACNMLKKPQIDSQIESQIWSQINSQIWSQIESQIRSQIKSQIWSQIESQIWSQINSQIKSQIWSQIRSQIESQIESQKKEYFLFSYYGDFTDSFWCAFYDYFIRINAIESNDALKKFDKLFDTGIFMMIQRDEICFISRYPIALCRDNQNRLHSKDGTAIAFKDGYCQHYVHGVFFSPEDFERLVKSKPKAEEILKVKNAEQRTALIQLYGIDYLGDNLPKYKVICDGFDYHGKPGQVFEFKIEGVIFRMVRYTDSSTGKPTVHRVERLPLTESVIGCEAWMGHCDCIEEYRPEVET